MRSRLSSTSAASVGPMGAHPAQPAPRLAVGLRAPRGDAPAARPRAKLHPGTTLAYAPAAMALIARQEGWELP